MDPRYALTEALVSAISAWGVGYYLRLLALRPVRSTVESRLMILMSLLCALLVVRGPFWVFQHSWLASLTFFVASFIPLGVFLVAEALLRRHFRRSTKILVLSGAVIFALLSLAGMMTQAHWPMQAFAAYLFLVQVLVAGTFLMRSRNDIGPLENSVVDSLMIAVLLVVPLFCTDMLADAGLAVPRLGSIGALILTYSLMRSAHRSDARRETMLEVGAAMAAAVAAAGIHSILLSAHEPAQLITSFAIFACVIMVFLVRYRYRAMAARTRESKSLQKLADCEIRTLKEFLDSIDGIHVMDDHRVFREDDLRDGYQTAEILKIFAAIDGDVVSRPHLRSRRRFSRELQFGREQLLDLLESHHMTHACLLSAKPFVMMTVNLPQVGAETSSMLYLSLIAKIGGLISEQEERRDA